MLTSAVETRTEPSVVAFPAGPYQFTDVMAAARRIKPYLKPTPLREYTSLNSLVGSQISVLVKHENHNPTNSFKVRNGLAALTALAPENRKRGVVAATRGNHGQGLAWAGQQLGIPVTICVPLGNNPEKNEAMRGLGAHVLEQGADYDEAIEIASELVETKGFTLVHATNHPEVLAGAATVSLEMLAETGTGLDAMVMPVGGGSLAVGALTVAQVLHPDVEVYAVQAAGAASIHNSWHAGFPVSAGFPLTIADGLATRGVYELTFPTLQAGLTDFVTVTDDEIARAVQVLLKTTHNLVEGAGAASLAGLFKLRHRLAGKKVGVVLSGANIDQQTLRTVLDLS
ncbi:MAG: threonine/serine dehydratase [Blastocatellia bacterium]|nr:threonine/serine dehydratase [Blastocatellia bacterium]